MKHRSHVSVWIALALSGCRKQDPDPRPVDCGENIECYVARAAQCLPTSVTVREFIPDAGAHTALTARYEARGRVRGRCHIRRTQLEPAWVWPDAGTEEPPAEDPYGDWRRRRENPFSNATGTIAPIMQCLLPEEGVASFMEAIRTSQMTPTDWASCYPGDGRCGPLPRLMPGCVPDECLLGRWIFVCMDNNGRNPSECEGTRLSDNSPRDAGCFSSCETGKEVLDCEFYWSEHHRELPLRTDGGVLF
jgi:hypothetical protein